MALNAFLRLKGTRQGDIKGSVTQRGREGSILVIASNHKIISPRDTASGLPTGKRQHLPFEITKEVDQSSPLLYNTLVTNENISEWELQFWRSSRIGRETVVYTVQLINASIAEIHFDALNNPDLVNVRNNEFEKISFTYQKIIWTWVDGGVTAEDNWEASIV